MAQYELPVINPSSAYDFRVRIEHADIPPHLPFIVDRVSLAYMIGTTPRKIGHVMHAVQNPKTGRWGYNKNNFYTTFEINKAQTAEEKRQGVQRTRRIQSPRAPLKGIQRGLGLHFWSQFPVPEYVTSYTKGVSIKDTAEQHFGKDLIVCIDIKDFFPSIKEIMIRKFLLSCGYPKDLARTISEMSTFHSFLPQGSPCSPLISNVMGAVLFDHTVKELADQMGYHYTRYADDLIFSCDETSPIHMDGSTADLLVERVTAILDDAGFKVATRKTKFMRSKSPKNRQAILGLVVNSNVGPDDPAHETDTPFVRVSNRKTFRLIRVMLHNALAHGVEEAARRRGETGTYYFNKLQSYIKSFLGQCDQRRHDKLIEDLNIVKALWEREQAAASAGPTPQLT